MATASTNPRSGTTRARLSRPLSLPEKAAVAAILARPDAERIVLGIEALARGEVSGAAWGRCVASMERRSRAAAPKRARLRRPA